MGAGMGNGYGTGTGRQGGNVTDPLAGLVQGTLTAEQKRALAGTAEEERLAHDVYLALARSSGDVRFTRIGAAETRHLVEVRAPLTRCDVTDPTAGKGQRRVTTAVRQQHTDPVARGSASPDVQTVYTRLTDGSRMPLRPSGG